MSCPNSGGTTHGICSRGLVLVTGGFVLASLAGVAAIGAVSMCPTISEGCLRAVWNGERWCALGELELDFGNFLEGNLQLRFRSCKGTVKPSRLGGCCFIIIREENMRLESNEGFVSYGLGTPLSTSCVKQVGLFDGIVTGADHIGFSESRTSCNGKLFC